MWRFPYLAAKYGGGAFLITYVLLAVTFGFTLMITEVAMGRRTRMSCIEAFGSLNRRFAPLGWLAALIPVIIAPYYCVIGGWVVKYFVEFVRGNGMAVSSDHVFWRFYQHGRQRDPGKSAALVRDLCAPYGSGGAPGR